MEAEIILNTTDPLCLTARTRRRQGSSRIGVDPAPQHPARKNCFGFEKFPCGCPEAALGNDCLPERAGAEDVFHVSP